MIYIYLNLKGQNFGLLIKKVNVLANYINLLLYFKKILVKLLLKKLEFK